MDNQKGNIEDFFNKSLEQFDGLPSKQVWDGIDQQLNEDRRKHFLIWRWLGFGIGILALIGLTAFALITNSKYQKTIKYSEILQNENQLLSIQLQDCNTQDRIEDAVETAITENRSPTMASEGASIKTINDPAKAFEIIGLKTPNEIPKMETGFILEESTKEDIETIEKSNLTPTNKINPLHQQITQTIVERMDVHSSIKRVRLGQLSAHVPRIKIIPTQQEDPRIKLGPGASLFIGISGKPNSNLLQQYNIDLAVEYDLNKHFSLTGAVRGSYTHYHTSINATNQNILLNFPGSPGLFDDILEIETHNFHIDFPVGIKWKMNKMIGQNQLFINPSAIWHIYLPQRFNYKSIGGQLTRFTDSRYFAYFGSISIYAGLERRITKEKTIQLGLWGEKSLIDLGVEGISHHLIGVRGAILFGL